MSDYILEARGITKSFPGVKALDGVDLRVRRGETLAIVGENGAGKSTLMMILTGTYKPDSGTILVDGKPVTMHSYQDAVRHGIAIVYQELSLVPSLSIAENIFANRQPVNAIGFVNRRELHKRAREALSLFDLGELDPGLPVRELGPANQQVVEILKAISTDPSVLILDEPTSSLTEVEASRLFANIRKLTDRGMACVYISHHLAEIFKIAKTVSILRDGRHVVDAVVADIDEDYLITNMVGRTITDIYGRRADRSSFGGLRFETRNLGRVGAFSGASMTVRSGEIVGFAGLVGAGRTEFARAIFGAEPPDAGDMYLDGAKIAPASPGEAIDIGIGYLTEDRKKEGLFLDFPVRTNLASNKLESLSRGPLVSEKLMDEAAERAIRDYRIASGSDAASVRNLSGGNQQKVLLGTWIGIEPRLLIVDEPTRGVDIGARSEIYAFLRALAAKGMSIIMISSDLTEILGLSDRIYVMKSGSIAGEVDGLEATEEKIIALATGASEGVHT